MRKSLSIFAGIFTFAVTATPSSAAKIVYTGSQQVDSISANYTITTDGTIGDNISASRIISFLVALTQGAETIDFSDLTGEVSGSFNASSTELSITRRDLFFFSDKRFDNSFVGALNIMPKTNYAQIVTGNGASSIESPRESSIFASVPTGNPNDPVNGAVPEPTTWAMMLVGFGGIGFAMRRRKSKVTTKVAFA